MPTYNGISYPETDFLDYGYKTTVTSGTGVSLPRWQAALCDAIADAGKQMRTTSVSSVAVGTGTKTFVNVTDLPYQAGDVVRVTDTSNSANYMYGTVTSYTSATKTLVMTVASGDTGGSGTIASWNVAVAGLKGNTGSSGATYDISASTAITTTATGNTLSISDGSGAAHNKQISIDNLFGTLTVPTNLKVVTETSTTSTAASTTTLDLSAATFFDMAHGANITTFTWSNAPAATKAFGFILKRTKDNSGTTRTIAWPASVKWNASTAPTLTQTANAVDLFCFVTIDGGTTWDGSYQLNVG